MNELQILQMQVSKAKEEIRCCNELNQLYGLTLAQANVLPSASVRWTLADKKEPPHLCGGWCSRYLLSRLGQAIVTP